ncbi:MAG: hypothetical protein JEZ08_04075 [Clostridiales bacterium]|nr:hypothetical protein [Clostridiales bacterium]
MKIKTMIFILLFVLLTGCSSNNNDVNSSDGINNTEIESVSIVDEVDLGDLSVRDIIWKQYDLGNVGAFEVIHLEEGKYLVGLMNQYGNNLNYNYHYFNSHTNESVQIGRIHQLIESIIFNENEIQFLCDGNNSMNGFKDFPLNYIFDVTTHDFTIEESLYSIGEENVPVTVGNSPNATLLESFEVMDDQMTFEFGGHETTQYIGGGFAPNIQISSQDINTITLDFKNLYFEEKQFEVLMEQGIVEEISYKVYEDIGKQHHSIVTIHLNEKYTKYACKLVYGENDFYNLEIHMK